MILTFLLFIQEIMDARQIRNRILNNFELSIQHGISEEETKRLLHFVIVGGGPTGVEFGAELYDFVEQVRICTFLKKKGSFSIDLDLLYKRIAFLCVNT